MGGIEINGIATFLLRLPNCRRERLLCEAEYCTPCHVRPWCGLTAWVVQAMCVGGRG